MGSYGLGTSQFSLLPRIAVLALLLAGILAPSSGTAASHYRGVSECSDGVDNDGDGRVDYDPGGAADDFGCSSANDNSESPNPECADGIDNDLDGKIDGFDAS